MVSRMPSARLIPVLLLFISVCQSSHSTFSIDADCRNTPRSPDGSNCDDFYVPDSEGCCIKMASYGRRCTEDIQCQSVLGENSRCDNSTGIQLCACHSKDDEDVVYFGGRCYVPRDLGGQCQDDLQCVLRKDTTSNVFAKCTNKICTCTDDSALSLKTSGNSEGVCIVENKSYNLNLTAITMLGSVALLLLVYGMYRVINKGRK